MQGLKQVPKIALLIIVMGVLIYLSQWAHVAVTLLTWCDNYPGSVVDCRQ